MNLVSLFDPEIYIGLLRHLYTSVTRRFNDCLLSLNARRARLHQTMSLRGALGSAFRSRLSIGPQTGPPIGVQKGPLWRRFVLVVHRRDPRAAERPTGGWRSGAWEVPVNPPVQNAEDAIRAGS